MAAMAEPVLLQYYGDTDAAQGYFEQFQNSRDPWLHAVSKVFHVVRFIMSAVGATSTSSDFPHRLNSWNGI